MTRARAELVRSFDDQGDVRITWYLHVLDEAENRAAAGPAGWVTARLPGGISLTVDYLDPSRILSLAVDGGTVELTDNGLEDHELQDDEGFELPAPIPPADPATSAIVAALVGANVGVLLASADADGAIVDLDVSPRTFAAGRFALLSALLERTHRPLDSLWAAEAAMEVARIDVATRDGASGFASAGAAALDLLPVERIAELFRNHAATLDALAASSGHLVPGRPLRELRRAARDALGRGADVGGPTPGIEQLESIFGVDPPTVAAGWDSPRFVVFRGRPAVERGKAELDPNDDRSGLFEGNCLYTDDGDRIEVVMNLAPTSAAAPPEFLGRLRAVARDGSGRVVDRSGFRFEGRRATATLHHKTFPDASEVWFEVTSGPRRQVVVKRIRLIESAVAAGQRAADLERAALAIREEGRSTLADAAETAWNNAAARWSEADNSSQAGASTVRAERCRTGDFGAVQPFAVERLAPAIAYWLDDVEAGSCEDERLIELSKLARAVGANASRVAFELAALGRAALKECVDLDETLWAALATRQPELIAEAGDAWLAAETTDDED